MVDVRASNKWWLKVTITEIKARLPVEHFWTFIVFPRKRFLLLTSYFTVPRTEVGSVGRESPPDNEFLTFTALYISIRHRKYENRGRMSGGSMDGIHTGEMPALI